MQFRERRHKEKALEGLEDSAESDDDFKSSQPSLTEGSSYFVKKKTLVDKKRSLTVDNEVDNIELFDMELGTDKDKS